VQGVVHAHEVERPTGELGGARDLERHPVGHAGLVGGATGRLDRALVIVGTDERAVRERLGHDDRRRPVPAADVGDARSRLQLLHDAVEGRQPRRHDVREIARTEEPLGAGEEVRVVLVPAEAVAGPEAFGDLRLVLGHRRDDLERAGHERRAALVGERHRLLGWQAERPVGGVVLHVAARRLVAQPFADVALLGVGARCQLRRRHRLAVGHRPVQTQPIADHDEHGAHRGSGVLDEPRHELIQAGIVDRLVVRRHVVPSPIVGADPRARPSSQRQTAVSRSGD
jgi:hypothetical protein